jgi:hypothetical protein
MSHETSVQGTLADLFARYLERQLEAQTLGVAAEPGEVMPYDAGTVQPIDARLAWHEALAPLATYGSAPDASSWPALPHWPALVAEQEPVLAVAFALGNFPQMVRDFHPLLQGARLAPPLSRTPISVPQLVTWAEAAAAARQFPQMLLSVGGLRLAKQFAAAWAYVEAHERDIPPAWRSGWDNEKAALAWHAGDPGRARDIWYALPPSTPVSFNLGLVELFHGEPGGARPAFEAAAAALPEISAWQHLARLYATMAQLRG